SWGEVPFLCPKILTAQGLRLLQNAQISKVRVLMRYDEALNYISQLSTNISQHRREYMETILGKLRNPHNNLKFIHIAGTNGKGSTANYISNILSSSNYRVGLFTSPHIERWNERIKINNVEIADQDFSEIAGLTKYAVEQMVLEGLEAPTIAQFLTTMALQYFNKMQCDVVVLETGCGGKMDPTNVISSPEVAVITKISLDHTNYFGNSIIDIAKEKAGIIKENTDTVLYPQSEEVTKILLDCCVSKNAKLQQPDFNKLIVMEQNIDRQIFSYKGYKGVEVTLLGKHQIENAIVALEAAEVLIKKGYKITENTIANGLKNTKWPGRVELLCKNPVFILDGAHNLDGIEALASLLKEYFPNKKIIFIYGGLRGKDNEKMIQVLAPLAERFFLIPYNYHRAVPPKEIAEKISSFMDNYKVCMSIEEAIKQSISTSVDGIVCVAGSMYYFKEFKDYFNHKEEKLN
ncbi:bifunctional folylpolyglutamate synthase/dihydrofolate synthase, partial [Paenibacillus aceti]